MIPLVPPTRPPTAMKSADRPASRIQVRMRVVMRCFVSFPADVSCPCQPEVSPASREADAPGHEGVATVGRSDERVRWGIVPPGSFVSLL